MLWILLVILVFSLLNCITITMIVYLVKKYILKKETKLMDGIWSGVFVGIICFVGSYFFISGMEKI